MDGIINDVDSLKKFQDQLIDTSDDLKKQLQKTENAVDDVAKTWKDSQFVKFHEGFKEDKEKITPLCKAIEEFEGDVLEPLRKILVKYLDL
jgi:uncharacterized protein YukE